MGDILRPLRFLGSVLADNGIAPSGQSTRQDRVGDSAINMEVLKPVQRDRAGVQVPC